MRSPCFGPIPIEVAVRLPPGPWCHWCHVLDRTSLSDPRVVRMLNEDFVPVRVDTDRRPDINDRYNQGGWPTTAVLLPDGQLLTGATYLPPDALAAVLEKCRDFYRKDRERVEEYLRSTPVRMREGGERGNAPDTPRPEHLALVKHAVLAAYDPQHPGFFREPKFPVPDILAFLRDAWAVEAGKEAGDRLLAVLRTMELAWRGHGFICLKTLLELFRKLFRCGCGRICE